MDAVKKASHPAYEALADAMLERHDDLVRGRLFGLHCVKVGKSAAFGAWDGAVVFRLAGEAHAAALATAGSELFDPGGKGRPMKAWVVVREADRWEEFAELAAWGQRG